MKIKTLAILPLAVLLAGCATDSKRVVDLNLKYVTSNSVPPTKTDTNAQAQVAEAAASINQSLQELSAIQMASNPNTTKTAPQLDAKTIGMTQQASMNWNGPVKPILEKIAAASDYQLKVLGSEPTIPVLVSIDAKNEVLATILRNVTYQVERKASITVYPSTKIIELRYYPT